jgi:hypothetical protein
MKYIHAFTVYDIQDMPTTINMCKII